VEYLLDASAVLALLQNEPGSERVGKALAKSTITAVNACEVLGVLIRRGNSTDQALAIFDKLHLPVVAFTYRQALLAATLLQSKVSRPLSLGDRACLGSALDTRKRVLTAERSWSEIDLDNIRIESIR
jgi:PIN domain nuclease of toxin-antitoxin system